MTTSAMEPGINTDMSRYPLGDVIAHADDRDSLVFVGDYPHSTDRVWQAMTDPERTGAWGGRQPGSISARVDSSIFKG